jgi:hypothetical protein
MVHSHRPRNWVAAGAAVVAATLLSTGPAHAAHTTIVRGTIVPPVQVFDDPDTCASEGFTVHAVAHERLIFTFRFDSAGNFLGGTAHHDLFFDISANGRTIHESDHYNNTFAPDGSSVVTGLETHILGEAGKIVLLDAGRIVFDANDNPTFLAGPHPQFLGATFCAALAA